MASMQPFDPRTALIVVDVQNDFAVAGGSLHVPHGEAVVAPIDALVTSALAEGGLVVYTQDWHPPVTPHFASSGGLWPDHCVQGTWGAEIHPGLRVRGPVVRKGSAGEDGYSGFTMRDPRSGDTMPTELDGLLRERGIERVVVTGLATDYCVKATALDARRLGYATTVPRSLIRAVDLTPGDGDRAIAEMTAAGAVIEG
jgi:nicotinamidase/pyrazinamidase